ncbi:MAG: Omp28-related outer membrane protein [Prevotella sp.]|nr:Omp28-related outer membrane protein [Prevotella sp.]
MKRLYPLMTAGLLSVLPLCAQKPLVLIEEFTNTGCGPCASWSPLLDATIDYHLGQCIAIKYHGNYPNPNDPFYLENKEALDRRIAYYHITAYPTTLVGGTEIAERSQAFMSSAIEYCLQQPERFSLTVSKSVTDQQLTVHTTLTPYADTASDGLRLFVAAIEEHLVPQAPYPNGETEANYTMRKMLSAADGDIVALTPLTAGQSYTADYDCAVDFMNDEAQMGIVAFVQDIATKEIVATSYAGPKAEEQNVLRLLDLSDTPDLICRPAYHGTILMRNDGANAITSATLNVRVNGTLKQYAWTGNMDYLERESMTFGDFTDFTLNDGTNEAELWLSDINGSEATSNTLTRTFSHSPQATYGVQLKLYTDKKPEETTWRLLNSAGDVVRQGGPYSEPRKFITVDLELTHDDCYQMEFLDAGGDGIAGANGNGYYQLFQTDEQGKTTRLTQGTYTGATHIVNFNLTGAPSPRKRLVLFEEFTNTSCDPCAEFSPALDKTIAYRMGDMVAITYHYNFPSPLDPFYLADTEDNMARANFYGVTGVPSLRVDGEHVGAWGYDEYLDGYVTGAAAIPATVDIETEAQLADGRLTVRVNVQPADNIDVADLRLHVAAVEERVEWSQPAANGERSWNYVMRKLLTGPDGQPVETQPTPPATSYQHEYTWQVQNYYDETELGIVAFVQSATTKQVLGAVYEPRPTGSPRAAKILEVTGTPDRICAPMFTSDLRIRNTGREPLTAANINVSVNGQLQQTAWTGSLDYLDITTVHTPLFTDFTLNDSTDNQVEIWLSDLNGGTEESVRKRLNIANAYRAQNAVRLTIMTDNAPEEISWQLTNSAGEVVATGGPYTEKRKKQVVNLTPGADDCYTLTFSDAAGNGITGENGRGYYMLHELAADGKTRLMVQADYTGATHTVYFSLQNAATTGISLTESDTASTGKRYDLQGREQQNGKEGIYIQNGRKNIKH